MCTCHELFSVVKRESDMSDMMVYPYSDYSDGTVNNNNNTNNNKSRKGVNQSKNLSITVLPWIERSRKPVKG